MPRVLTAQDRREQALLKAIDHGMVEKGIRSYRELADLIGMNARTFSFHKKQNFERFKLCQGGEMFRKLGITGRQLAVIFGVPGDNPKEDA